MVYESFLNQLEYDLYLAQINSSARDYLHEKFFTLLIGLILIGLALIFFSYDFLLVLKIVVIFFCLGSLFVVWYPKSKHKRLAKLLENDLPFLLLGISLDLSLNAPFEKAFRNAASENHGLLSQEFRRIIKEIEHSGSSLQEALFKFGERTSSKAVKRAVSQLISAYEQGPGELSSASIKEIANELLKKQQVEVKAFSEKLVVISLMFIIFSAVAPALIVALIVIGGVVLDVGLSELQVLLLITVVFPLIDVVILGYIRSISPLCLGG